MSETTPRAKEQIPAECDCPSPSTDGNGGQDEGEQFHGRSAEGRWDGRRRFEGSSRRGGPPRTEYRRLAVAGTMAARPPSRAVP